jgi:hypothetical protein
VVGDLPADDPTDAPLTQELPQPPVTGYTMICIGGDGVTASSKVLPLTPVEARTSSVPATAPLSA